MFQLVVAVISIALIAFMALTSLYYGGDAFSASSLRAGVTTLVNGGTQIAGAATIFKTDMGGIEAASIADLTSDATGVTYLRDVPGGAAFTSGTWTLKGGLAFISLSSKADKTDTCAEVSRQAGNSGMFRCGGADGVEIADSAAATTFVYGRGAGGTTPVEEPSDQGPGSRGPVVSFDSGYSDEGTWVLNFGSNSTVDDNDSVQPKIEGGPVTWSLEATDEPLPAGITFDTTTGRFRGASSAGGMHGTYVLHATDAKGVTTDFRLNIYIGCVVC